MTPIQIYQQNIEGFLDQKKQTQKKLQNTQLARTLLILLIGFLIWYWFPIKSIWPVLLLFALFALFLWLVNKTLHLKNLITHTDHLIRINENEISFARGNYYSFPEGSSFKPALHHYANDLDIFGRASIYQYINRTTSEQAQFKLASWLLHPAPLNEIYARQDAAKKLSEQMPFRQQLQALGIANNITQKAQQMLEEWSSKPNHLLSQSHYRWLSVMYPIVCIAFVCAYAFDFITDPVFYIGLIIMFLFSTWISKKLSPYFTGIDKVVDEISTLSKQLELIENTSFDAPYLEQWKQTLKTNTLPASHAIKALKKILDRYDYRLNPPVFIPLNMLSLWHLQVLFQLQKWRQEHHHFISEWFEVLAQIECIGTIGNIVYNHPDWSFPTFDEQHHGTLMGTSIGHPLIPLLKRVPSDYIQEGKEGMGQIAIITGSNMAGKSTFLRSIGVNMVLAMMGAPVCAKSMKLSPMLVMSSMRIADNLEENTSTFYAELKKLKEIIESVNKKEKVFLLLDEILRGTNSLDRHAGSEALLLQLIKQAASGMIATHDLSLGELVKQLPQHLHNYHFDVQVEGEELYFDYQLKKGICTSMNASILMKKIGIEL